MRLASAPFGWAILPIARIPGPFIPPGGGPSSIIPPSLIRASVWITTRPLTRIVAKREQYQRQKRRLYSLQFRTRNGSKGLADPKALGALRIGEDSLSSRQTFLPVLRDKTGWIYRIIRTTVEGGLRRRRQAMRRHGNAMWVGPSLG
jgi:hypothetical protein